MEQLYQAMSDAFQEEAFLHKLARNPADAAALFDGVDWAERLAPLLPMTARIRCRMVIRSDREISCFHSFL